MSWISRIRPQVRAFEPYVPGRSIDSVRQRYGLDRVIKLASNENPLGASPLVQRAVREHAADVFRYPVSGNPDLCAALARHHGVAPSRIVVGNGSDELIDLLFRALVDPVSQDAAAFSPCFGIYTTQSALCGARLRQSPLNEDFSFPWKSLLETVTPATSLVFVTTPDNPSGFCPPVAELETLARSLPETCLLVLDEAYMDFADEPEAHSLLSRLDAVPNAAILRTFSKSRGLAGLRLGYGIFPETIAEYLRRIRLPFSVNLLAEKAGMAALEDEVFYQETLRVVRLGRAFLTESLERLACTVYPSLSNFLMFQPPDGHEADDVNRRLLERGVIIRPLASYGLPHLLRVSVGSPEENAAFIETLKEVLA